MVQPDAASTPNELGDLLANLFGFYSTWALSYPTSQILPSPEMVLIDSGTMADELNIAFVDGMRSGGPSLEVAAQFFRSRSRPWRIEAPISLQGPLDESARAVGLHMKQMRPGFVLSRGDLQPGTPKSELSIDVVDNPERAAIFQRTLIEGNSGSHVLNLRPLSRYRHPEMTCYVGSVSGEPVATAVLYTHRGVAGIYAVATVMRARRRGYGRAITERAVQDGFDLGCSRSFLQSSDMGRPVYEAMGYRWLFDRVVWTAGA
jgi:GNAT superfamily N-acetyltransferase